MSDTKREIENISFVGREAIIELRITMPKEKLLEHLNEVLFTEESDEDILVDESKGTAEIETFDLEPELKEVEEEPEEPSSARTCIECGGPVGKWKRICDGCAPARKTRLRQAARKARKTTKKKAAKKTAAQSAQEIFDKENEEILEGIKAGGAKADSYE